MVISKQYVTAYEKQTSPSVILQASDVPIKDRKHKR
jgi:hypothetical protein